MPGGYKNIKPSDGRQWKKGESGNPKGKPKKLPDLQVLLAEVLGEEKDGKSAAEIILMALRSKAVKGDLRAAEALLDRGYGKPKQVNETKVEVDEQIFKIGDQIIKFK